MNTDEIIEAAIQGHASTRDAIRWAVQQEREAWQFNVQMAVLNERKECAKLCEKNADDETEGDWNSACFDCADRIRARGNLIVLTPSKGE
jgi:hypothetical protein